MEPSTAWLCSMDPSVIDQWELGFWSKNIWTDINPLSSESYPSSFITKNTNTNTNSSTGLPLEYSSSYNSPIDQRPSKLAKSDSWESSACSTDQVDLNPINIPAATRASSSPTILSFASPDSPSDHSELYESVVVGATVNPKEEDHTKAFNSRCSTKRRRSYEAMVAKKVVGVAAKPPIYHNQQVQVQDHVLAERKRREKLTQKFIALSAIVPGLKKMDKASVLEDAIKYLKQLEEKVKDLEEQAAKRGVESAVLVKKSQLLATDHHDHGNSGSAENLQYSSDGHHLPEIEVRLSDKSVLVRMHCENRKGLLVKALSEIENLHLTVINTSVAPFAAGSSLDVTVMAQTEEGFSMTVKDLVKNLNLAIRELI